MAQVKEGQLRLLAEYELMKGEVRKEVMIWKELEREREREGQST
jgi:hypothetical protein